MVTSIPKNAPEHRRRWPIAVACMVWGAAITIGLATLWRYQLTPGTARTTPTAWPVESALTRHEGRPIVVQFIHPRCACSRASLIELERLLEHVQPAPEVLVAVTRPDGVPDGWERSGHWERAERIPQAQVVLDLQGIEAARFGAETSGHTVVYDAEGRLLFSGGITRGRGEQGANAGSAKVATALAGLASIESQTPVFGCSMDALVSTR